jgi:hypothetical protein
VIACARCQLSGDTKTDARRRCAFRSGGKRIWSTGPCSDSQGHGATPPNPPFVRGERDMARAVYVPTVKAPLRKRGERETPTIHSVGGSSCAGAIGEQSNSPNSRARGCCLGVQSCRSCAKSRPQSRSRTSALHRIAPAQRPPYPPETLLREGGAGPALSQHSQTLNAVNPPGNVQVACSPGGSSAHVRHRRYVTIEIAIKRRPSTSIYDDLAAMRTAKCEGFVVTDDPVVRADTTKDVRRGERMKDEG